MHAEYENFAFFQHGLYKQAEELLTKEGAEGFFKELQKVSDEVNAKITELNIPGLRVKIAEEILSMSPHKKEAAEILYIFKHAAIEPTTLSPETAAMVSDPNSIKMDPLGELPANLKTSPYTPMTPDDPNSTDPKDKVDYFKNMDWGKGAMGGGIAGIGSMIIAKLLGLPVGISGILGGLMGLGGGLFWPHLQNKWKHHGFGADARFHKDHPDLVTPKQLSDSSNIADPELKLEANTQQVKDQNPLKVPDMKLNHFNLNPKLGPPRQMKMPDFNAAGQFGNINEHNPFGAIPQ